MKFRELANLSRQELLEQEKTCKVELYKLNYQRYSGRVEKPAAFRRIKTDIARIKTALRKTEKQTNVS